MTQYSTAIPRISGTEDASVFRGHSRLDEHWRLSNWHPHVCTVSPPNWWFYCDSRCHDAAPEMKEKILSIKARKYYYNSGESSTYMDEWGVGRLFWLFLRSLNGAKVVKCYKRKLRYGFDFLPVVTFKNNNML